MKFDLIKALWRVAFIEAGIFLFAYAFLSGGWEVAASACIGGLIMASAMALYEVSR